MGRTPRAAFELALAHGKIVAIELIMDRARLHEIDRSILDA